MCVFNLKLVIRIDKIVYYCILLKHCLIELFKHHFSLEFYLIYTRHPLNNHHYTFKKKNEIFLTSRLLLRAEKRKKYPDFFWILFCCFYFNQCLFSSKLTRVNEILYDSNYNCKLPFWIFIELET